MAAGTRGPKRGGKENAPLAQVDDDVLASGVVDDIPDVPVKPAKAAPKAAAKGRTAKARAAPAAAAVEEAPTAVEEVEVERPVKPESAAGKGAVSQKKVDQLEVESKRLRSQRDDYARQFEELSNLRNTSAESTLEKFKANIEVQGKAKDDIISTLTQLNEKLQAKIQGLEKAARADAPKADPKEIKALKEAAERADADLAKRNTEYAELEKMYKAEQQFSQGLQASRSTAPAPTVDKVVSPDESAEDAAIIRLYEDITELNCVGVKIRDGRYGPKDKILDFNCILTPGQGSSINFRLRTFKELDPAKQAQRARNPYNAIVQFTPELSRETDQAFIQRLGKFQEEIRFMQEELPGVMRDLRSRVAGEAE